MSTLLVEWDNNPTFSMTCCVDDSRFGRGKESSDSTAFLGLHGPHLSDVLRVFLEVLTHIFYNDLFTALNSCENRVRALSGPAYILCPL
jgi:hypothetical protein